MTDFNGYDSFVPVELLVLSIFATEHSRSIYFPLNENRQSVGTKRFLIQNRGRFILLQCGDNRMVVNRDENINADACHRDRAEAEGEHLPESLS